jgi:hypothetical protein
MSTIDPSSLSEQRLANYEALRRKSWFQATDPLVQSELIQDLPESHNGFLASLLERPDVIGGARVDRMVHLARGNFLVVPVFEVTKTSPDGTEHRYTYEYASWRQGPKSGAEGIVFLERNGEITHFVILRGEKFATGKLEDHLPGGFVEPDEAGVKTLLTKVMEHQMREELGLPDVRLVRVISLGGLTPDSGMSNTTDDLFACVIDASEAQRLNTAPPNRDVRELDTKPVIYGIDELSKVVTDSTDGYLLSALVKSVTEGLVPAGKLERPAQPLSNGAGRSDQDTTQSIAGQRPQQKRLRSLSSSAYSQVRSKVRRFRR